MTKKKPTLLILAAGMGSRYGGLKQLDPVGPGGATIMDYSVFDALRAGFDKVVFVIRRDFEHAFRESVAARYADKIEIAYAFQSLDRLTDGITVPPQRTKPWGTAHAMLCAQDAVDAPFAAINADDFYGEQAFRLQCEFLQRGERGIALTYAMIGYPLRSTLSDHGAVSRGVCHCDADGNLTRIVETHGIEPDADGGRFAAPDGSVQKLPGDAPVSMNMWGFFPSFFEHARRSFAAFLASTDRINDAEFYIPNAVQDLLDAGKARVKVLPTSDRWFGVTYREDKPHVEAAIRKLVAEGRYPAQLWPK